MQNQTLGYDSKVEGEIIVTQADAIINWIRKHSVWPMPMGLACCAIELMAAGGSRFDISRFGMEVMRFSPRQADCMIVAGTVTYKWLRSCVESTSKWLSQNGSWRWVPVQARVGCIVPMPRCKVLTVLYQSMFT